MRFEPIEETTSEGLWPATRPLTGATVVGVGARCYLREDPASVSGMSYLSIGVDEFVDLSTGRRLSMRWDRGATLSWDKTVSSTPPSAETLTKLADGALLPDEGEVEDAGESRSWHEYADLLQVHGLIVAPDFLKGLPYVLEFSADLRAGAVNSES